MVQFEMYIAIPVLFLLVWPTSWTPALGGLIVSECVRGHVAIIARRMMNPPMLELEQVMY